MQTRVADDWSQWDVTKNPPAVAGQTSVAAAPPSPSPRPVSATVGLTPGYTPDYRNLILSDPSYLAWKNSGTLDVNQAAAKRKAALQALTVQHGGLPATGFQDQYGDIDQGTLDLANKNQFSDVNRIQKAYTENVEAQKRALAARGALQSGDTQYALNQADYARAGNEYDVGQQFSNTYQDIINNYLGVESGARQAEAGALGTAEANVYGNPANRPAAGTEATLMPNWQDYGQPVYQGPDGNIYAIGADGNPVPFSGAAASAAPAGDPYDIYTDPHAWGGRGGV